MFLLSYSQLSGKVMRDIIIVLLLMVAFYMFRYYKTWLKDEKEKAQQNGEILSFWTKLGGLAPALACVLIAGYLFVS